jgi:hypothetical protein
MHTKMIFYVPQWSWIWQSCRMWRRVVWQTDSPQALRGGIQDIPAWCRHLYISGSSAKHRSQQAKLRISGSTATSSSDCVKTCEDVAPKFGCFTMTTPRLTLPCPPSSFWRKTKWLSFPTHRTTLIWQAPCDFFLFPKMTLKLKGRRFDKIEEIQTVIAERAWHSDRKWLSGSVPKMEEIAGPVSTCGREISVRNILDTPS